MSSAPRIRSKPCTARSARWSTGWRRSRRHPRRPKAASRPAAEPGPASRRPARDAASAPGCIATPATRGARDAGGQLAAPGDDGSEGPAALAAAPSAAGNPAPATERERRPIDPDLPPDHPLEPGATRTRGSSPADRIAASEAALGPAKPPVIPDPGGKSNFIAAARRAAQAAASEAPAPMRAAPAAKAVPLLQRLAAGLGQRVRSVLVVGSVVIDRARLAACHGEPAALVRRPGRRLAAAGSANAVVRRNPPATDPAECSSPTRRTDASRC